VNAQPAIPIGIAASPATICNGQSSTISVNNPGAGFTTDWYTVSCGGTPVTGGTGFNSLSVSPAITTVYYAQTRNISTGCLSACTNVTIIVNALPVAPTASVTIQPTCTQPTGTIIITSPTTGLTFSLDGSAYAAYPAGGYTLVPPGPHTLTAQNASNCISAVTNVTVNPVPNGPTAIAATPSNATCGQSNGTITLGAVTGGTAPFAFSVNASAFTGLTYYSGLAAGPYNVQVSDANGCIFSTIVSISNASGPTAIATTPTITSCGQSNGTIILGAVTGGTPPFTYSLDASAFTASTYYSSLAAGLHSIQVRDANGCIFSTTVTISNANGPTAIDITLINATCGLSNGTMTLGAVTGGTAPFTYSVDASSFTASTFYASLAAGSHGLYVRDANGCIFATSVSISNANGPTAIEATPAGATCGLSNGTIAFGTVTGGSAPYTYSVDDSDFIASTSFDSLAEGSHSIQVRDVNGCIFSTSVFVSNASGPTAIAALPANAKCGLSNGTITLGTVSGGSAPYTFSVDASPFTATTFYSPLAAGIHNVQVMDINGCTLDTIVTIIQDANTVEVPVIDTITQPSCTLASGSVVLTGLPLLNWTINPGAITGTGSATTISGLDAGTYNFTITNNDGCISPPTTDVIIYEAPGSPKAPIVGTITQPSCTDTTGSIELIGLPALNWIINPGAITGTGSTIIFSSLEAGTYKYTVTNANGCISPASANVVISPAPGLKADFSFSVACLGHPTYFTDNSVSYSAPLTFWEWTVKDSIHTIDTMSGPNPSYTFGQLGLYSVIQTVSNSAGCMDSINYMITVYPSPTSAFKVQDNNKILQGQIQLINESTKADTYLWDFGNSETSTIESPVITYKEGGDFLIKLISRNSYGCVDSSSIMYKMLFKGLWVPNALAIGNATSVGLWKPVGVNLISYKADIYDRSGKIVWSSDKLTNGVPSEGWDGTYKGKLCQAGAYAWKISATFIDGSIWPNADVDYRQNVEQKGFGTITLIR